MPRKYIRAIIVPIGPSIAYVPLTKGLYALIDEIDRAEVSRHNWRAKNIKGFVYAIRTNGKVDGHKTILLHRSISGFPDGLDVDHRSGNTLDDRRSNLLSGTHTANMQNRRKHKNNASGYQGVYFDKTHNRWRAQIRVDNKQIPLGRFDTAILAYGAYKEAKLKFHGLTL